MEKLLLAQQVGPKLTFTLNEVIVRLLGWRPFDFRCGEIISSGLGSSEDTFPPMLDLEEPYSDVLNDRFQEARRKHDEAVGAHATPEAIEETVDGIRFCVSQAELAKDYEWDILRELEKGDDSELRADFQATVTRGQLCLHRRGLVRWAQENYESDFFSAIEEGSLAKTLGVQSKKRTIDHDGTEYPIDKRTAKGGLTPTSTNSLFITFASLIEFAAEKCGKKFGEAGVLNVTNLAVELSKRAHLPSKRTPMFGQKPERIKDRIEDALRVKSDLWNAKKIPKPKP